MLKKGIFLFLTLIFFQLIFVSKLSAQDNNKVVQQSVTGKITEIAVDSTYLKIDDKKIVTDKTFLDDSFVAVGDNVRITVEDTPQGIHAIDYKYIYEEDNNTSDLDEDVDSPDKYELNVPGE